MASKFMKIKKIVIPFITLVIMTSQLAGCATLSSQELREEMNKSSDVEIEWAVPDTSQQVQETLDNPSIINLGAQEVVIQAEDTGNELDISDIGLVSIEEKQELSEEELIEYFGLVYDTSGAIEASTEEERINIELDILVRIVEDKGGKLPARYAEQYRLWRPEETTSPISQESQEIQDQPEQPEQQVPVVTIGFTDTNEVVYATGSVNLRSGPGTNYNKVGSLKRGDSITRTGVGTGDAAGWSRIVMGDEVVYVSSKCISTTKPVVTASIPAAQPPKTQQPSQQKEPTQQPQVTQPPVQQQPIQQQPTSSNQQQGPNLEESTQYQQSGPSSEAGHFDENGDFVAHRKMPDIKLA